MSWWGWEQAPKVAVLGHGDGKQRVEVIALHPCRQRKHSPEQRVPGGLGLGAEGGHQRVTLPQRTLVALAKQ